MTRFIAFTLAVFLSAVVLTPGHLKAAGDEAIEFDNSLANQPNTTPIIEPREMSEVIEPQSETEKSAGLPQFNTDTFASQLFWLALSFAILYFFFARKTLPAISSTIESRQSTIKNDLNQADSLSTNIENTKAEYEAMLAGARTEAATARADVEQSIRNENERQAQAFNEKADTMINDIEAQAVAAKTRIQSDLETITSELVEDIVNQLTNLNVDKATIRQAVEAELSTQTSTAQGQKAA